MAASFKAELEAERNPPKAEKRKSPPQPPLKLSRRKSKRHLRPRPLRLKNLRLKRPTIPHTMTLTAKRKRQPLTAKPSLRAE